MTDKEAIKYLQQLYPNGGHCWLDEQRIEAIDMAVKALQEEPVAPKLLEDMLNAKTAAESLGISQEEHDRIVDELIYGKEPELVDVDDLPNKEEEPVSEIDFEQELYKAFGQVKDFTLGMRIAKRFYDIGRTNAATPQSEKPRLDIEIPFGMDSELIEETIVIPDGCHAVVDGNRVVIRKNKDFRERYKRIAQSDEFKRTHDGASIGDVIKVDGEDIGDNDKKAVIDTAMAEVEEKSKAFTDAHKGESADEILAEMRGEEPVSEDLEKIVEEIAEPTILNAYGTKELARRLRNTICGTPVSEDLEEACEQLAENARKHKAETSSPFFSPTDYKQGVMDGAKWQKQHLWKPADGDDLPIIDREVIALLDNGKVVFAHRPPEFWDGKDIVTGKVTRNYPKTYDKGGWNIPDVKWWLDCLMPKEIGL